MSDGAPLLVVAGDARRDHRSSCLSFLEDRIVVVRRGGRSEVPSREKVGFDDGSAELVGLRRPGLRPSLVPTRDEKTRTAVLALLDARGIRRHE